MARTSPSATIAEVFTALNGTVTGVNETYDHEPASWVGPAVAVSYAGQTPDFWLIRVRIYTKAAASWDQAQADLADLVPLVMAKLDSHYGPDEWTAEYEDTAEGVFFATCILQVGRE